MRKTPKKLSKAFAGVVAVFFAAFVMAPPAFAGATLNVSQTDGLKDGQVLTISGSGFTPSLKDIAIGQCAPDPKGPADCNMGGSTFVAADASGNIAEFTLVVNEKFGATDCLSVQCVFGSQPLPGAVAADVVASNTVYHDLKFGEVAAAPAPAPTAAAPTASAAAGTETLPQTGAGETLLLALLGGLGLLALGGATLFFMPRTRGGVA